MSDLSENYTKNNPADEFKNREEQLPDDGHAQWDWKTKYPGDAWKYIWADFTYLMFLFLVALIALYLLYAGYLYIWHTSYSTYVPNPIIFKKEMYCILMGFLGGITYSIKILYKSVARGKWHRDRVLWRLATPWVSLALSIVVASLMANDIFSSNNYAAIVIGFFAGYFSESAIGKLYEIAGILFK